MERVESVINQERSSDMHLGAANMHKRHRHYTSRLRPLPPDNDVDSDRVGDAMPPCSTLVVKCRFLEVEKLVVSTAEGEELGVCPVLGDTLRRQLVPDPVCDSKLTPSSTKAILSAFCSVSR